MNDAQFDADRDDVLKACVAGGVTRFIEIADSPADWDRAVALSRARPFVRASLGLHPYYAAEYSDALAESLPRKAKLPEVVAVGEIGLDYVKGKDAPEVQKAALTRMLAAAWAAALPVVLHCRGAYPDLLAILEAAYAGKARAGRFHGVVHCFSGETPEALRSVELGFALGVDGPVTYPKNEALRAALKAAGLDSLVLETDSPYLPPQSSRGKRNDPRSIPEIAAAVGRLFNVDAEEAGRRTAQNGLDLYRLTPAGHKA
ncbi:MAG: TatD DNase family protein [Elusimicrobia bacterium]|nr:MAG: TatD DNase family protein [Elusimicrobiota bacterium]